MRKQQNAFYNKVAQEIGKERALELEAMTNTEMGAAQGIILKEQIDQNNVDAFSASKIIFKYLEQELGIIPVVKEESPDKVVYSCGRCPVFESYQVFGTENKDIETACRASAVGFMDALVKQLNPELNYELILFRSGADDSCDEAIFIGKDNR
jgi:hypothetical protein